MLCEVDASELSLSEIKDGNLNTKYFFKNEREVTSFWKLHKLHVTSG